MPETPPPPTRPGLGEFALVLVLALLLALWGAFLVPFRVGGLPVPVSVVVAVVGNLVLCRAGARVLGRRSGAAVPALLWLTVAVLLSSQRREGDLVVPASVTSLAFLLLGALAAAVAVGLGPSSRPPLRSRT